MTTTTSTFPRSSSSGRGSDVDVAADLSSCVVHRSDGPVVTVRRSHRDDGDFHRFGVPFDVLERRRRGLVDHPWTMLDQRHGVRCREVRHPGEHDGATGDVASTGLLDSVLACWAGDCAPVVLVGAGRRVAVAHAGWRGLAGGVLGAARRALGEPVVAVVLGPTVGPCCYEFGRAELCDVASAVGLDTGDVAGRTANGGRSLDVPAVVAASLGAPAVQFVRLGGCTGCEMSGFSHRVRAEPERHVIAVWQELP